MSLYLALCVYARDSEAKALAVCRAVPNKRLHLTGISVPLTDSLQLGPLSPSR
jgi:hypothetical protein